jgi:hypothetical protein
MSAMFLSDADHYGMYVLILFVGQGAAEPGSTAAASQQGRWTLFAQMKAQPMRTVPEQQANPSTSSSDVFSSRGDAGVRYGGHMK